MENVGVSRLYPSIARLQTFYIDTTTRHLVGVESVHSPQVTISRKKSVLSSMLFPLHDHSACNVLAVTTSDLILHYGVGIVQWMKRALG